MDALTTLRALIDVDCYAWIEHGKINVSPVPFKAVAAPRRTEIASAITANKVEIMVLLKTHDNTDVISHRLSRAVDILFDRERRGKKDGAYWAMHRAFISLLCQYELLCDAKEVAA